MSNRDPGHLPRPGGIMGQTKAVRDDLQTLSLIYRWAVGEADAEQADQDTINELYKNNPDYTK